MSLDKQQPNREVFEPCTGNDNNDLDQLYTRVHQLVTAVMWDAEPKAAEELSSLIRSSERARRVYYDYVQETSILQAHVMCPLGDAQDDGAEELLLDAMRQLAAEKSRSRWWLGKTPLMIAASIALVAFGMFFWTNRSVRLGSPPEIATVLRVSNIESGSESSNIKAFSKLREGETVSFDSGQIEILFDSEVELLVEGPAEFRLQSPLHIVSSSGKYAARVGQQGKGFTITTPVTSVTDLGTEFGVTIKEGGATGVAVFDGEVDVQPTAFDRTTLTTGPIRLIRGEGVAISKRGETQRIMSIRSGEYPVSISPGAPLVKPSLFADVTDNLGGDARKFYRICEGSFSEDAQAFVDRGHQWNGIDADGLPPELVGADYIMPFNDYKFLDRYEITVHLRAACMLYVFLDNNMEVPTWLREEFRDTGLDIGLDHDASYYTKAASLAVGPGRSIDGTFSVWSKEVLGPQTVTLGGVSEPVSKKLGWNMYGIAAVAHRDVVAHRDGSRKQ